MNRALFIFLFFCFSVLYAQHSKRFDITNSNINTENNEFGVILTNDNSVFYLKSPFENTSDINEKGAKLFKSLIEGKNIFSKGKKFPTNAIHAVFTKDGKNVYFSEKQGDNFQLYKADIDRTGRWKNSVKLPFNDINYTFKHPALNKGESKLFFASDMPGSTGKTDIYFVNISNKGLDL